MKTIKEISDERSIDRSTLLKAAQDGRIPARKSGDIWLVDDETEEFKTWLAGTGVGRPRRSFPETIYVETPEAPEWVLTPTAKRAWRESLEWRANAACAHEEYYRQHLLHEAEQMYG